MSLNYKGLPHKTEWINVTALESTMKELGAPPTAKKADGSPKYTVPVIYDPKTRKYVSDSWEIAKYLDETYPDKPTLFPQGTAAAIALLQHHVALNYTNAILPNMQKPIFDTLSPDAQAYFRAFLERGSEKKFEDLAPSPSQRLEIFDKVKASLTTLADILDKNAATNLSFFVDTHPFTYGDIIVVSFLLWPRFALPSKEWEIMAGWNSGRWGKMVEASKVYQTMH